MYDGNAATVIGRRVGNYVIERGLAQGNMGSVFVARHPALGREAAVKFLGSNLDASPEMTKRFLDEARITASLRHPNIVDIFDFGELDGRLYYVMELLDGLDLAELIRIRQRFASGEVVDFMRQVCSGLVAAHSAGVVHRDLKPGNMFVVRETPARLKLMDFGVAKVLSTTGEQTHYGQIIGTPRYMSPEQALGQIDRIGPQSDIYSLGVIAYEMLAGRSPFEHQSPVMLLVMHVHHQVYPLDELAPDVPAWLVELIEACLAKEPKDRPASAQEVLGRISQFDSPTTCGDAHLALPSIPGGSEAVSNQSETRIPIALQTGVETHATSASAPCGGDTVPCLIASTESRAASAPPPDARVAAEMATGSIEQPVQRARGKSNEHPVAHVATPIATTALHRQPGPLVALSDADRTVLNRLLLRMQRRGDFPAFVQNVGEVSKRADFESSFSAEQLGTAILKDYALTAKLLRIVNSTYANRFGGRIYSVRHAIVILGFDRVRSLALSISLFKSRGDDKHSGRVSESAISALVSGEIARQVSSDADLDDPEQATVCAMFRKLGKHLVLVYLPEMYDQILELMQRQGLGMNQASERVLGLSMHKLGVGIAERWRLPNRIISAMSVLPERTGRLTREQDRLAALADFSNDLCEIIAEQCEHEAQASALKTLLSRHKNLVQFEQDDVMDLVQNAQRSFEQRYASLLGAKTRSSRFARAVATLSERRAVAERASQSPAKSGTPGAQPLPGLAPREPRPRTRVKRLQLARYLAPEQKLASCPVQDARSSLDDLVSQVLDAPESADNGHLLIPLLGALARELQSPRLLVLRATQNRRELTPVGGIGEDVDGIMKELRLPLGPARTATDPFSVCYHAHRDFFIDDVFAPRVACTLPRSYFEVIGSSSLALISCAVLTSPMLVLTIDSDPPHVPPRAASFATLGRVRTALAKIAPLSTV